VLWGDEDHVRALFGDHAVETRRDRYVERVDGGPAGYVALVMETFGPAIAIRGSLDGERAAAFDRDFLDFATRHHDGDGIAYDYLLVLVSVTR
jgi:hypothetical protein